MIGRLTPAPPCCCRVFRNRLHGGEPHKGRAAMNEHAVVTRTSAPSSAPPQYESGTGLGVTQPIPSLAPEKFIPVDRKDIISQTLDKIFEPSQRVLAGEVLRYICALRQAESAKSLDTLVELYDAFNPDDETVNLREISSAERKIQLEA